MPKASLLYFESILIFFGLMIRNLRGRITKTPRSRKPILTYGKTSKRDYSRPNIIIKIRFSSLESVVRCR